MEDGRAAGGRRLESAAPAAQPCCPHCPAPTRAERLSQWPRAVNSTEGPRPVPSRTLVERKDKKTAELVVPWAVLGDGTWHKPRAPRRRPPGGQETPSQQRGQRPGPGTPRGLPWGRGGPGGRVGAAGAHCAHGRRPRRAAVGQEGRSCELCPDADAPTPTPTPTAAQEES